MEQKVGISICRSGSATRIAGDHVCHVEKGVATVLLPSLPLWDVERSADFEECHVVEERSNVDEAIVAFVEKSIADKSMTLWCRKIDEEVANRTTEAALRYNELEYTSACDDALRPLAQLVAERTRMQVMAEVIYAIASVGRKEPVHLSRSEQVFAHFILLLSQSSLICRTVAYYATEAHLTVRHFSDLVHTFSGQTPSQWIAAFTIERAKQRLREPEKQVKEVAHELGFPEQFTFRKYFKHHTGMSPTDYRKQQLAKEGVCTAATNEE